MTLPYSHRAIELVSRIGLDIIIVLSVALIYVIGGIAIASSPGSPIFFNAEKDRGAWR